MHSESIFGRGGIVQIHTDQDYQALEAKYTRLVGVVYDLGRSLNMRDWMIHAIIDRDAE